MKFSYKCEGCDLEIEIDKKISESHPTYCEFCGKNTLYHVINPTTTIYNCSGFYAKDNNKDSV